MDRSDLIREIQEARRTGTGLGQAVARLESFDRQRVAQASQDRELDLAARHVTAALTPVALHEHHSEATDWLGEIGDPRLDYRVAMMAEASGWIRGLSPEVLADREEFTEQALGRARTAASAYGSHSDDARDIFLSQVANLSAVLQKGYKLGASGLPQIDQMTDPNNQPSQTPYPTEIFDNFAPEQDAFNTQAESPDHQGWSSEQAPMIQQLNQQNSSGSGFGGGPEKPDEHTTSFDTSNSYAEVPLGPPGQIPTGAPGQGPSRPSAPAPVIGQPQDASMPGQSGPQEGEQRHQAKWAERDMLTGRPIPVKDSSPVPHGYAPGKCPIGGPDCPACAAERGDHRASLSAVAYTSPDPLGFRWFTGHLAGDEPIPAPLHEKCASAHFPDQRCGNGRAHVASVALDYSMDLAAATRVADCERMGASEGLRAVQAARGNSRALAEHHNRFLQAWGATDRTMEDTAVLHGFQAVVRPVLAGMPRQANQYIEKRGDQWVILQRGTGKVLSHHASEEKANESFSAMMMNKHGGADHGRSPNFTDPRQGRPETEAYLRSQAASSLPVQHQVTDPDNVPTPQDDQFDPAVMFPFGPAFARQWETGPQGARPKGAGEKEAARSNMTPSSRAVRMFGRMDAMEGRDPQHKDHYAFSVKAHGQYLRDYNGMAGVVHAVGGQNPWTKAEYAEKTGRPDLHGHYMGAYATAWAQRNPGADNPYWDQADDASRAPVMRPRQAASSCPNCPHAAHEGRCEDGDCQCAYAGKHLIHSEGTRRRADIMTRPHQTTDDFAPPYNTSQTSPDPWSSSQGGGDYRQGFSEGQEDARSGERPTFMDNSSGVSPYVSGYAEGYASVASERMIPGAHPDVPRSMGGDSGQARNAEEATRSFQVSKASLQVSAAFTPREALEMPDFTKGYNFARRWRPGRRLVTQGSAEFEAGVYAGISDNAQAQSAWVAEHRRLASRHVALGERLAAHESFTRQYASEDEGALVRGLYVQAATSLDLVTDGPGTSPDPAGSTPLNGPGTIPPMGGGTDPARSGGPSPYQGAPPGPSAPVAPDDVLGQPQEPPQPDGKPVGFSGPDYGTGLLAPQAPNRAAGPGYSNPAADIGNPHHRQAAFRAQVQANLRLLREGARAS